MPSDSPKRQRTDGAAWTPNSWEVHPKVQMAEYDDKALTAKVMDKLRRLPPLIQASEADQLKSLLAAAGRGERFIMQGGDCAERFDDCNGDRLEQQLKLMLQMSMMMENVTGKPAVCICRIAGQYGKPRSKPTEVVEGFGEIMSFKGENINGIAPTERKWDPERLVQGYFHSSATLNFLRSYSACAEPQDLAKIQVDELKQSPQFGAINANVTEIGTKFAARAPTQFFTAHEAMQLDLEAALTRKVHDKHYNLSAHLVWIGDRTRQIPGAHVEYCSGISNPIGCKVGPTMSVDDIKQLVQILNPDKEEGRLLIITRYGAAKVREFLPKHIEAVKSTGVPVTWQCDCMHGNGIVASNGYKTRKVDDIIKEITECAAVHKECGSVLGGVHFECTGQTTVTECLGGCTGLTAEMLSKNYETLCDPRLNYGQSIEAAFAAASALR